MKSFQGFTRGINFGGWLSQDQEGTPEHIDTFITEKDFQIVAEKGYDHVRIPVDYTIIETEEGQPIESGYRKIDEAVAFCRKYHLHMILDIHEVYGYSFDPLKDTDKEAFFSDSDAQERFYRLWETIVTRYQKDTDILAFELLNEVVPHQVYAQWNAIASKAITRIRTISPDCYIIVGGVKYNAVTSVKQIELPFDAHTVLNFHCYEPMVFTHQGAYWVKNMDADYRIHYPDDLETYRKDTVALSPDLADAVMNPKLQNMGKEFFEVLFAEAIAYAESKDVPLYCGEYGVIDIADAEDAKRWYKDIEEVFQNHHISYAAWTYKALDFSAHTK